MSESFSTLLKRSTDQIVRAWVDQLYSDQRTDHTSLLSYRQLIDHLPDFIDELASLLDRATCSDADLIEAARRWRLHAQVRFQQGVLLDEVARELMTLRRVLSEVLWREADEEFCKERGDLQEPLARTNAFIDEIVAQAIIIYAASLRPPIRTRDVAWPPPRQRKNDSRSAEPAGDTNQGDNDLGAPDSPETQVK